MVKPFDANNNAKTVLERKVDFLFLNSFHKYKLNNEMILLRCQLWFAVAVVVSMEISRVNDVCIISRRLNFV